MICSKGLLALTRMTQYHRKTATSPRWFHCPPVARDNCKYGLVSWEVGTPTRRLGGKVYCMSGQISASLGREWLCSSYLRSSISDSQWPVWPIPSSQHVLGGFKDGCTNQGHQSDLPGTSLPLNCVLPVRLCPVAQGFLKQVWLHVAASSCLTQAWAFKPQIQWYVICRPLAYLPWLAVPFSDCPHNPTSVPGDSITFQLEFWPCGASNLSTRIVVRAGQLLSPITFHIFLL